MTRLCPSEAIPDGEYRVVDFGTWTLLVARVAGTLHVVENICGHQSRRMDGGALKTGSAGEPCIECPHHAMCFDLRDGHIVEDAGHLNMEPCRAFASIERDGMIWVELPA